jgi:hypothetical protein
MRVDLKFCAQGGAPLVNRAAVRSNPGPKRLDRIIDFSGGSEFRSGAGALEGPRSCGKDTGQLGGPVPSDRSLALCRGSIDGWGAMPKPKARACFLPQHGHGRAPLGHGTQSVRIHQCTCDRALALVVRDGAGYVFSFSNASAKDDIHLTPVLIVGSGSG